MRTGSVRVFRIAGVDVYVHVTWLVVFALVTWTLAVGYYPSVVPTLSDAQAWIMGAVSAVLLFASVLAHEFAHSLVARARGMEVDSITLFIFGGVSNLKGEAPRASTELLVSIAGPLTSLVLAVGFFGVGSAVGNPPLKALFGYLAIINALLGLFNLVPGFPLDGGRILRALVWQATGDLRRASAVAMATGQVVGYLLMLGGIALILADDVLDGIWILVIGWFLESSAGASMRQMRLEAQVSHITVREVMRPDTTATGPNTPIAALINDYLVAGNRRAIPVLNDDRVVGMVTLSDIQAVPLEERAVTRVTEIMGGRNHVVTVTPDTPLADALRALAEGGFEQLPVLDDGRLVGVLSRADIIQHLHLREALHLK